MKLSEVCTKGTSNIAQKDLDDRNGVYPIYGASGFIKNVDFYHQEKPYIAIVKDGAGVGRVMQLPAKSSVIGTMQYIIPNEGVSVEYLAYALEHMNLSKYYLGAAIPHIYFKDYCSETLPNHTPEEQAHISHVLGLVCNLISLRKQQLSKLDELVKSRFIEMFGSTILNPFGWKKDNLGAVCDVRDGTHDSPQYYETGYPLVTSKNVTGGKIDLTDCSLICEADYKKINERSKVDMGDIIMPMIGTVGKPVIVDIEPSFAIKNVSLIKFKVDSRVLNIYIRALLQSDYFDDAILSKVRGGTQKFISLGDIRKLEVLVPPMKLQEQFAVFVEQVDKSKFEIQKSLEKLEILKKSLMQQYFG